MAGLPTLFMLSAWLIDAVGIHAVFGGSMLGVAMPRGGLTEDLKRLQEPLTAVRQFEPVYGHHAPRSGELPATPQTASGRLQSADDT